VLLPAGEQAVVEDVKLLDYVLNPEHPVGRHHAGLFERLLGITRVNYDVLKEQLLQAAMSVEVEPGRPSPFGDKFEMRFLVRGPLGTRRVLAVWLREEGQTSPRLITCYVE
jgi:uncharacterized protein DUF6883